jgi:integrase
LSTAILRNGLVIGLFSIVVYSSLAYSFRTVPYDAFTALLDLSRKRDRERLSKRREPYWQRLCEGGYLGFRRGSDTWVVRYRGRDKLQQYNALEGIGPNDYDDAKRRAEAWIAQLTGTAVRTVKRSAVQAALQAYLEDLRRHGRPGAASEALWRFKAIVYEDVIAELELESATRDDFLEWRDRLLPGRKPRSVNRMVRAVVAGLNRALELGYVGNPSAWRLKPLSDDVEDANETAVFLTPEQRKTLVAAASPACAAYLRGLELTGARPSELAAATVGDFDGKALKLAHRKGRPPKLRTRYCVLGVDGVAFFAQQAVDKLPTAPLFTEDGEQPWRRHIWAREIRTAISKTNEKARGKARIPAGASAYSFRHARISELLQVHCVDPLTVAQQTGTSIAMIEKAYMRFIPAALQQKLAAVKEA